MSIVMDCVPITSRWASEQWRPFSVLPLAETLPASMERIDAPGGVRRWRFDGFEAELHRSEGEGYWLNLTSPEPKAFVMWRPSEDGKEPAMRPHAVTLSYNEAARMLDGGEQVDGVPLAPELAAWMKPFVDANYTPEPRRKARRNDPFATDREPRG